MNRRDVRDILCSFLLQNYWSGNDCGVGDHPLSTTELSVESIIAEVNEILLTISKTERHRINKFPNRKPKRTYEFVESIYLKLKENIAETDPHDINAFTAGSDGNEAEDLKTMTPSDKCDVLSQHDDDSVVIDEFIVQAKVSEGETNDPKGVSYIADVISVQTSNDHKKESHENDRHEILEGGGRNKVNPVD